MGSLFEAMGAGGPQAGPAGAWGAGAGPQAGGYSAEDIDFGQFFGDRFGGEMPGGLGDIFAQFRRQSSRAKSAGGLVGPTSLPRCKSPSTAIAGQVQLTLHRPSGEAETIVVKIPPGIEDGKETHRAAKGEPAAGRGAPGYFLLAVRVLPHPFFRPPGQPPLSAPAGHARRGRRRRQDRCAYSHRNGIPARAAGHFQWQETPHQGARCHRGDGCCRLSCWLKSRSSCPRTLRNG